MMVLKQLQKTPDKADFPFFVIINGNGNKDRDWPGVDLGESDLNFD